MLFSEEDYEYTLKKIEELIDDVMPRMKWDKDDIKILKKLNPDFDDNNNVTITEQQQSSGGDL